MSLRALLFLTGAVALPLLTSSAEADQVRARYAVTLLGIPLGTMKSRLNRATQALRAALEADDRASAVIEGAPA